MSLAAKMYIKPGTQIPCVNLAADVNLDDIKPWAANFDTAQKMVLDESSPSLFVFVENSTKLSKQIQKLKQLWDNKITFWLFYPKSRTCRPIWVETRLGK